MAIFGKRVDFRTGRRKALRERVMLAGSAHSVGASRSVVVTDVSSQGAKLLGRQLPKASDQVVVKVGRVELFATVAWAAGEECGIAFEDPLTPRMAAHLKRDGHWASVMGLPYDPA